MAKLNSSERINNLNVTSIESNYYEGYTHSFNLNTDETGIIGLYRDDALKINNSYPFDYDYDQK
ncbi:MAG: hypothetical protein GQ574_11655 [Crocinitomix sp.]|nr:hypothetical protein [Crocinitomix sp.]